MRTTIGNMSPEYGSTMCDLPDRRRKRSTYLRLTGRSDEHVALVEAYAKAQGMFRTDASPDPQFTDTLELDLSTVEPNLAGPRRPQDRVPLRDVRQVVRSRAARSGGSARNVAPAGGRACSKTKAAAERPCSRSRARRTLAVDTSADELRDGSVVIAAITSCTNTSNPAVLIGAGLLAKKAVETRPQNASRG